MGEDFISKRKKGFQHGRDVAVEEDFKTENFRSRLPDVSTTVYRCILTVANYKPTTGALVALAELTEGVVSVLDTNVLVGRLQPQDALKLQAPLRNASVRMLVARVHSVGKLGKTFTITIETDLL